MVWSDEAGSRHLLRSTIAVSSLPSPSKSAERWEASHDGGSGEKLGCDEGLGQGGGLTNGDANGDIPEQAVKSGEGECVGAVGWLTGAGCHEAQQTLSDPVGTSCTDDP